MENWRDWESPENVVSQVPPRTGAAFGNVLRAPFRIERQTFSLVTAFFYESVDTSSQPVFGLYSVPLRFGQAWRASSRSHRAWGRVTA